MPYCQRLVLRKKKKVKLWFCVKELIHDTTWSLYKQMANKPLAESSWFSFFSRKTKAYLSFDLGQPFGEQEQYKEKYSSSQFAHFMWICLEGGCYRKIRILIL